MKKIALLILVIAAQGFSTQMFASRERSGGVLGGHVGQIIKGAQSIEAVDQLSADVINLEPKLKKTADYLKLLGSKLKQDGQAYKTAKNDKNPDARLKAQQEFIKDLVYMKAVGGFIKFVSYIFEDLETILQLSDKASAPFKKIKEQILDIRTSLAPLWEIPKDIAAGENLKVNTAQEEKAADIAAF